MAWVGARFCAVVMKLRHISAGAVAPLIRDMGLASSRPIQVQAAKPPV